MRDMAAKNNNHLILITIDYPFGALADVFLNEEIPYLCNSFNSVVIVPRFPPREGQRVDWTLPINVSVDTSLIKHKPHWEISELIRIAFSVGKSKYLYAEILRNPRILLHISSIRKAFGYLSEAHRIEKWVLRYISENQVDLTQTVFYTYWLDGATMGVGLAKHQYSKIKLISRAHGGDLYDERHSPPYLPYRLLTLTPLDRLYLISEHGKNYITERFPAFKSKFTVSRLGVRATGFISKRSSDAIFRIVSCSSIILVKRIHLIILGLKDLGLSRPDLEIEWVHIGSGILREEMEKNAATELPKNVRYRFLGCLPNYKVMAYYKHNQIDVFVNVSSSEGVPVSIMEAQSCGIPVIATSVGGTPEIVSGDVGLLISENPSPAEIANALGFFVDHPFSAKQLVSNSVANWNNRYNADKNYADFANDLKKV